MAARLQAQGVKQLGDLARPPVWHEYPWTSHVPSPLSTHVAANGTIVAGLILM